MIYLRTSRGQWFRRRKLSSKKSLTGGVLSTTFGKCERGTWSQTYNHSMFFSYSVATHNIVTTLFVRRMLNLLNGLTTSHFPFQIHCINGEVQTAQNVGIKFVQGTTWHLVCSEHYLTPCLSSNEKATIMKEAFRRKVIWSRYPTTGNDYTTSIRRGDRAP